MGSKNEHLIATLFIYKVKRGDYEINKVLLRLPAEIREKLEKDGWEHGGKYFLEQEKDKLILFKDMSSYLEWKNKRKKLL